MFEKVNPSHPDKVADRIAGAIVDLAYSKNKNPKVAVEVLIGHQVCHIINETDTKLEREEIREIVDRITNAEINELDYVEVAQDKNLAKNQKTLHCGDNGIFKGVPTTKEQKHLTDIVRLMYEAYPYDGKYIINEDKIIACQSNCKEPPITFELFNPLGYWTGGTSVDTGATNRKLGSDMGDAVTGGGLHGKDLSKADVSVNIYLNLLAEAYEKECFAYCSIGSEYVNVDGKYVPFKDIVDIAREYINKIGGFEKFAEWGLI